MRMEYWKTQQTLPTFLLLDSESPWKLLVAIHHGSMERIKDTTEEFKTLLEQDLLTVILMKTNGDVQHKYLQKSIDEGYIMH